MPRAAQEFLSVLPVPALRDNEIWLIRRAQAAAVVDPGDAAPVFDALAGLGVTLGAILLTHHHPDHVGGVPELVAAHPDGLRVHGPAAVAITGVTDRLADGASFVLDALDLSFSVIGIPGHTRGHIAFHSVNHGLLFCGDTLFACGSGRLLKVRQRRCEHRWHGLRPFPRHARFTADTSTRWPICA